MDKLPHLLSKARYSYQNQTRNQASDALSMYRNLKPFLENCTLPNGTKRDLVCLKGTIPVTYRSSVYNIPISIWILNNYPYSAPICWVNPTKNMVIKVSQVVDNSGRVYLPYLANWSSETSDLLGVIQVMIIAFSQTPPLYSTGGSTSSSSNSNTSNVNRNVTNPPYPTNFGGMYPQPSTQSNYYPPIPISATPSNDGNANPPYPAYPSQPSPYYPMPMPNASQTQNATTGPTNSETISAEHIRLSLESAAEDLLKNRLKELCSQYEAEINVIRTTGNDLKNGKVKLTNTMNQIENNLEQLNNCSESFKNTITKLDDSLTKASSLNQSLDIDEYFGPSYPLYKQLFNSFIEESTLIDTIFYLNEALKKGIIDLEVFIKYVRELSRRLFMKRALIKRCREKANLPT